MNRRGTVKRTGLLAAGCTVALACGLVPAPALAYFTAGGSGTGTAATGTWDTGATGTMDTPGLAAATGTLDTPGLAAAVTATSATLSWDPLFEPTGYDLTQSPGSLIQSPDSPTGCDAPLATGATSCTASGLIPNTSYTWSLSAAMHSWGNLATVTAVTPKQATKTINTTTPTTGPAGTSFTATAAVTGDDSYGTPAGTVTFGLYTASDCSGKPSSTLAQDLTDGSATRSLQPTAGTYYWQAAYTPTDEYNNPSTSECTAITVSENDAATNTVSATIPVGVNPDAVAVTPDGAHAYVTNESSQTVSVIAVPVLSAGTVPAATVGDAYSFTVPAVNVTSFVVTSGALPAGLGLNAATGVISGTPTTAGSATFTVTGAGLYGQAALAYTISPGTAARIGDTESVVP
ncbi:MAG: putative Ig domain-containing protein [Dermatophilaceae bacterium]